MFHTILNILLYTFAAIGVFFTIRVTAQILREDKQDADIKAGEEYYKTLQ